MAKIKQIINCETNKKFIQFLEDGDFFIPDVLFYILTEEGDIVVHGEELFSNFPKVGEELYNYKYKLIGQISTYIIEEQYNKYKEAYGEDKAKKKYNNFLYTVKQQLPLFETTEGVCLQPLTLK